MLRPTFFMQMFSGMTAPINNANKIVMPCGNGTVSTTDLRDVGEVVRLVFTEDGHAGQSYDLTGPELLTFYEIAERFSEVLGRKIDYVDQPLDAFRERLEQVGFPPWRINAVSLELEAIGNGSVDHTTDTLDKLLGRPATNLTQFIEDHRALFTP